MASPGIICLLSILCFANSVSSLCFFPTEFQGEYVTQSSSRGGPYLQYSPVTILQETIPVWGVCHRRMGNRVILMDRTGGMTCVRCFQFTMRSLNVVQIYTEGLEKCYTNEAAAMAKCPTEESIISGLSREIILYKTKELSGDEIAPQEYCPVNGRYFFTYSVNDGLENVNECHEPVSELSNCPDGSRLNLQFKRCSFGELEINFKCLGDWVGHNGERYMALLDVQDNTGNGVERRPRYRCAMYKEDPETGQMRIALSSDSTCQNDLRSPKDGYETLSLSSMTLPPLPYEVSINTCQFPTWAHGQWQDAYVESDTLVYKDLRNFNTYSVKCMVDDKTHGHNQSHFVVYARTQCGDDFYTCLIMEKRGLNVIEFQLGSQVSSTFNESLCQSQKITQPNWVTQGRINVFSEEACPVSGEYTGVIPDATGLCAKLYSDCHNQQKMLYTVSNCLNQSEIYEEREYRCLGKWTDKGLMYTYTERRDILGYECFVGAIISESELFIKEAGEHCQRDVEPLKLGMKLVRQATCHVPRPSSQPNPISISPDSDQQSHIISGLKRPTTSAPSNDQSSTELWNPVPGSPIDASSTSKTDVSVFLIISLLIMHLISS